MTQAMLRTAGCNRCFSQRETVPCKYTIAQLCRGCAIEIDRAVGFLRFYGITVPTRAELEDDANNPPTPLTSTSDGIIHYVNDNASQEGKRGSRRGLRGPEVREKG
jgi:hypothetical protein